MPGARVGEVMAWVRGQIAGRALQPGERLPSIRALAGRRGLSPSTVAEAYDHLVAEGVIRARRGAGFFVAGSPAPLALAEIGPALDREIDPLWVSRQSLDARAETMKPGCGWMPPDWMPNDLIRRALRGLARSDDWMLADYGPTRGSMALRQVIARQLQGQGIDAPPERILLTGSGTQAVDLVCRYLLRPGDTVLVDDPCYFNFQALLKVHRVHLVSVPYTPQGPDLAALQAVLTEHKPRLYITNSALQNPTGATLAPHVAHQVLTETAKTGTVIVEDDIFAGLEPEIAPRLAALDGLDRVIRIGSFSKTLSASIRCGYVVARPDWTEDLVDLQVATSFGGPSPVAAGVIHTVLSDGSYRRYLDDLRRRLARARAEMAARLEALGLTPWIMPRGGFYLWCALPEGRDSGDVARRALAEDVVLAPGNVFSPSLSQAGFMRFNVSQMGDARVWEVLSQALKG